MRFLLLSTLVLTLLCCHRNAGVEAQNKTAHQYERYCASCHGASPEVFAANSTWKHGRSRLELIHSIRTVHPKATADQFLPKLDDKSVADLGAYLLAAVVSQREKELNAGGAAPASPIFKSEGATVRLDTMASGISNPWGMAFLPNGGFLFTERSGKLFWVNAQRERTEIKGVPPVLAEGQGGLLDVELDPDFKNNQTLYLSYSKFRDSADVKLSTTAVYRARLVGDALVDGRDIFVALPYFSTTYHYGSRLEFDRKGLLYITVGERGKQDENPQNLRSDCGKVHRIYPDGHIPTDNPYYGDRSGTRQTIWSYGHRNPQGLVIHPQTGEIWETEHGPRGGDELNVIQPKVNYGWPVISYGTHYDGRAFTQLTEKEGIAQPVNYWVPSIAPSGLAFVTGDRYPAWKGDLLVGSLRYQYLNRCRIEGQKVVAQEALLKNLGRMRCVTMSPDGYIYVAIEEPGYIFRLLPN